MDNIAQHGAELAKEEADVLALEESVARAAGHLSPPPAVIELTGITPEMEAVDPRLGELARELRERASAFVSQSQAAPKHPPEQDKGPEINMGEQEDKSAEAQQQATPEQQAAGAGPGSQVPRPRRQLRSS